MGFKASQTCEKAGVVIDQVWEAACISRLGIYVGYEYLVSGYEGSTQRREPVCILSAGVPLLHCPAVVLHISKKAAESINVPKSH